LPLESTTTGPGESAVEAIADAVAAWALIGKRTTSTIPKTKPTAPRGLRHDRLKRRVSRHRTADDNEVGPTQDAGVMGSRMVGARIRRADTFVFGRGQQPYYCNMY
jgi:hypothetical protein